MLFRRILYWSNFTVIRWQFLITLLAFWGAWSYLESRYNQDDGGFWIMMEGAIRIIFEAVLWLCGFSLFTAFIAWIWFHFRNRNGDVQVKLAVGEKNRAEAGLVPVTIEIPGVVRPLLGTVRARLVFSKMRLSESVLLDLNVRAHGALLRRAIKGTGAIEMHDRGIYDVEEVNIFFCDMLRLIAIPFTIPASKQLFTLPRELPPKQVKAYPNTTEEQKHRIEIPKRVEGEYLSYKDFEGGDDVRRVVWKIYARTGDIVVRIPETMDPYASHLYFYASFYNALGDPDNSLFETELLNVYKDKVRNLYEALQKNGFDMRLPHDQETPKLAGMSDKKNELFHIAAASWQKTKRPDEFIQIRKAAFVTMSSAVPAEDISRLLQNLPLHIPVVAFRLSDAISSPLRLKFRHLFFRPRRTPADKLRRPWTLSPLRIRLQRNERELQDIFKKRGNAWLISSNA
ncbi:MAG TPA: DUF58 domain-containing protein [Bacteroidia bacterium]|nr:DUF58 domain-containing protein [Bacteroidia bacterium]